MKSLLIIIAALFIFPPQSLAETTADGVGSQCRYRPAAGGLIGISTSVTAEQCKLGGYNLADTLTWLSCGEIIDFGVRKVCKWQMTNAGTDFGILEWTYPVSFDEVEGDPGQPPLDCATVAGAEILMNYDQYQTGSCVNGCGIEQGAVMHVGSIATGETVMRAWYTGNSCGTNELNIADYSEPSDGCISHTVGSTTNEVCVSDTKDNCGYFNGQFICADSVPNGTCQFIQGGSFVCSDAPQSTPPLPDDGTQGQVAMPDATIDGNGGSTTQIYSSTTVSNSTTTVVNGSSGSGPSGASGDPINVEIDEQAIADAVADSLTETGDFNPVDLSGHVIDTDPTTYGLQPFDGVPNTEAESVFELPVNPTGTCTDPSWNWAGNLVQINLCSWWVPIREWIGWLNAFFLSVFAYFRLVSILSGPAGQAFVRGS